MPGFYFFSFSNFYQIYGSRLYIFLKTNSDAILFAYFLLIAPKHSVVNVQNFCFPSALTVTSVLHEYKTSLILDLSSIKVGWGHFIL
jgi:hypothetical protein